MTRVPFPLPIRPRWPTPDAAVRECEDSPLDAKAQNPARIPGGQADAEEAIHTYSLFKAAMGQLSDREQRIVRAYAHKLSYRQIAKQAGLSTTQARRVHLAARERLWDRLAAHGLCPPVQPPEGAQSSGA